MTLEHPTPEQLLAFDTGKLSGVEQAAIERHVEQCAVCCKLLQQVPENEFEVRLRTLNRGSEIHDTPLSSESSARTPAELISHPRIDLQDLIGTGGMGAVYKGIQRQLGRVVAIKILHRRLTERVGFTERFLQEM